MVFFCYESVAERAICSTHSVPVKHALIFIPSPVFEIGVLIQENVRITSILIISRGRIREPQAHEWRCGGCTRIEQRVELKVCLSDNLIDFKLQFGPALERN